MQILLPVLAVMQKKTMTRLQFRTPAIVWKEPTVLDQAVFSAGILCPTAMNAPVPPCALVALMGTISIQSPVLLALLAAKNAQIA